MCLISEVGMFLISVSHGLKDIYRDLFQLRIDEVFYVAISYFLNNNSYIC